MVGEDGRHLTNIFPGLPALPHAIVVAQLLEMDEDDEDREFSKSIVVNYFEQATETFEKMNAALWVLAPSPDQPDPAKSKRAVLFFPMTGMKRIYRNCQSWDTF